jgi:hypothetical protein
LLPVHNVQATLPRDVGVILEVMPAVTSQLELLLVDDGSIDGTEEVAWELTTTFVQVDYLRHPFRLGLLEAIHTGLSASRGQYVMIHNGASPVDAERMAHIWRKRNALCSSDQPDLPAVARWCAAETESPNWLRRLMSWGKAIQGTAPPAEPTARLQLIRRAEIGGRLRLDPAARQTSEAFDERCRSDLGGSPADSSYHFRHSGSSDRSSSHAAVPQSNLHRAVDRLQQRAAGK